MAVTCNADISYINTYRDIRQLASAGHHSDYGESIQAAGVVAPSMPPPVWSNSQASPHESQSLHDTITKREGSVPRCRPAMGLRLCPACVSGQLTGTAAVRL